MASSELEPELDANAIAAYADQAAAIVRLPIAAEHRPDVIEQFGRLLAVAALSATLAEVPTVEA